MIEPIVEEETICSACGAEWGTIHHCEMKILCPFCGHLTDSTFAIENDKWLDNQLFELRGGSCQ